MRNEPGVKKNPGKNYSNGDEALKELRNLLVGPEQNEIQRLHQKLDNVQLNAEGVGRVLPEAIQLHTNDKQLVRSLQPSVEEALRISIERDPRTLVNVLFPLMGPAIRKAIAATFAAMIQSFNQSLDHSLSLRGLKWRWEAIRTGKPFSEIVLLHSLTYRVEQVFLIHKPSGLLLQHVIAPYIQAQDADLVSGMLTAIQDFIRDSFHVDEEVNAMQVGPLSVWIEQGPNAYLASVIRGVAPQDLRTTLQETLEKIHLEMPKELESFSGDSSRFEMIRPVLEDCLQLQYKTVRKKTSPVLVFASVAALLLLGWYVFTTIRQNAMWQDYVGKLKNEPGIVITEIEKKSGKFYVSGLVDPMARNPIQLLAESELDTEDVVESWQPYQALEPRFILSRATKILQPPRGVTLRFQNGILSAAGSASQEWSTESKRLAKTIAGVQRYDDKFLNNSDLVALEANRQRIEKIVVRFLRGNAELLPEEQETVTRLLSELTTLLESAKNVGIGVRVEITGRADSEGNEMFNLRLSKQRAEKILQLISSSGLDPSSFRAAGVGTSSPLQPEVTEEQREYNRSVTFQIQFLSNEGAS